MKIQTYDKNTVHSIINSCFKGEINHMNKIQKKMLKREHYKIQIKLLFFIIAFVLLASIVQAQPNSRHRFLLKVGLLDGSALNQTSKNTSLVVGDVRTGGRSFDFGWNYIHSIAFGGMTNTYIWEVTRHSANIEGGQKTTSTDAWWHFRASSLERKHFAYIGLGVGVLEYKGSPFPVETPILDKAGIATNDQLPFVAHSSSFYGIAFGTYYQINPHLYMDVSWRIRSLTDGSTKRDVPGFRETQYAFHLLSSLDVSLVYVF